MGIRTKHSYGVQHSVKYFCKRKLDYTKLKLDNSFVYLQLALRLVCYPGSLTDEKHVSFFEVVGLAICG